VSSQQASTPSHSFRLLNCALSRENDNSGDVLAVSGHGATAGGTVAAGALFLPSPFPAFNPGHQSKIQCLSMADTLSAGYLSKEPLAVLNIEPAVQSTF